MRFGRGKPKASREPFNVRPSPSTKPPYCGKCGKAGEGMMCGACARAYKEWVEKNCGALGGNTEELQE